MLFLGGFFDNKMENDILKKTKGSVQYAANKFQWNLIDGLLEDAHLNLFALSAPFIGAYPRQYNDIFFEEDTLDYRGKLKCDYVQFNNLWGYRNISRQKQLKNKIKVFAETSSHDKVIIVYSPHTPLLQAAVYAKKADPSIHICLVVPDLPQYMNLSNDRSLIYDILKKIDIKTLNKIMSYVDSFVLLTSQMKEILKVNDRPYVVVEGLVSKNNVFQYDNIGSTLAENNRKDKKSVVYTGTLNEKFGVINLVNAFIRLDMKDVELIICGTGDAVKTIKDYSVQDDRIIYMGQTSNTVATEIQKNATVLVNPRQNNEEFTKYSFPSKNMEYLLSGNPLIAYKLDGIPDEYDPYIHYVENDSIEAFTNELSKVLNLPEHERKEKGERAQRFVLENKNNIVVSEKITNMIIKSRGI
ncbi:glycosyltransferase [Exiguobacterium sp. s50]|uniref:glycosyltransferase n=1 Tax=Exiguobacterium sp. s50 TaxID=2751234 RepID=UPI00352FF3D2